ncbi:Pkinase-domain-containing protein [Piromyces finnis]|uniref:Pkinase-domain-containing protein n=1 Tax=Piromyces finnis TaxID=1754191 RepID=A0A1Y1UU02_9FUNG|nr:Pkinase-domain-containing protein [Piromyces finnis]|eukprot:ORX41492.1 Pkinase-domain-containing protein [Piromyces finnis]
MQYNLYNQNEYIQKNNIINKLNNQYSNSSANAREKNAHHFSKDIKDYQFGPLLGKGAFGEVFKAVSLNEKSFGEVVAIKRINIKKISAIKMIKRIRNEIEIQYHLNHPSILRLYNFSETEEYVYLIMEYCENGELYKYLQKRKKLPEEEVKSVMEQLVEGVKYLHHRGILHRDLKLANLFLTSNYKLKIGDFGLATQLNESNSEQYTLCGTPNYIAPEIIQRQPYSLPTDIWSIGCLFVTLLTGKPPFECKEIPKTLEKVINVSYEIPSYISVTAADLIDKLLQKDPVKRISLDKILDHLFFKTGRPSKLLTPIINSINESSKILADLSMKLHNKMLIDMYNKEHDNENKENKYEEFTKSVKNHEVNVKQDEKIILTLENKNKYNKYINGKPESTKQNNIFNYHHLSNQNFDNNNINININEKENDNKNKPSELYDIPNKENQNKLNRKKVDQNPNNDFNKNIYYNHDTSNITSSAIKKEKILNYNFLYNNSLTKENDKNENKSNILDRIQHNSSNTDNININNDTSTNVNNINNQINDIRNPSNIYENYNKKYKSYPLSKSSSLNLNDKYNSQPYTSSISSTNPSIENIKTSNNNIDNIKDSNIYYRDSKILSNNNVLLDYDINELNNNYSNMVLNDFQNIPKSKKSSDNFDSKFSVSENIKFNHGIRKQHSLSSIKQPHTSLSLSPVNLKHEDENIIISTERLKPCKVSFKAGKLEILKSGHVFVRFTKDNYILIINGKGEKISVYNKDSFSETESGENILKSNAPKTVYIFRNLPSSLYSIYSAISKIIQYIRSKTPKIIFYSSQAQCLLMENQPYPDFEMRFYNDVKLSLRISHQAIEISFPTKYLEEQNIMNNVNVKAIKNNFFSVKIPISNFDSSYLLSTKLIEHINEHDPSIVYPIINHFQVCFKQCLSFQSNKNISKYPLIVKCKVMEDKKLEEENASINNVYSINHIPPSTNSNLLLNEKNSSSHIINDDTEGIISSSITNKINQTSQEQNISNSAIKKIDNYTTDNTANSIQSTTLFNSSSMSINQTTFNKNNNNIYSTSYLQSKNNKHNKFSEGLLRKAHSEMNLNSKKNLCSSNIYSNSEILASISETSNKENYDDISKTNENSIHDFSQLKRNSSPITISSNATSSATVTNANKSQPNESLSTSSSLSSISSNSMTTFIPKVGWCIKTYGKFSIFFIDGTNIILESRKPNQLQYLNYQDINYKKHIIYYLDQPIPKDVKQKLSYIFKFRELMKTNLN